MQIHEAVTRLTEAGYSAEAAQDFVVLALQARVQGGWADFAAGPTAKATKAEAEEAFACADIDPDAVTFPAWYQPLMAHDLEVLRSRSHPVNDIGGNDIGDDMHEAKDESGNIG